MFSTLIFGGHFSGENERILPTSGEGTWLSPANDCLRLCLFQKSSPHISDCGILRVLYEVLYKALLSCSTNGTVHEDAVTYLHERRLILHALAQKARFRYIVRSL